MLAGTELLFQNFVNVRRLFDMSHYYREATNAEVVAFGEHGRICLADGFDLLGAADSGVRRHIGRIAASGVLENVAPRRLRTVAIRFELALTVRRIDGADKIELPQTRRELKKVLKFLSDDYLESSLIDARYVTNSKRRLNGPAA